jgi:hypothetical protein
MHKEIFSEDQLDLLPLVKQFVREFYLVGGTAIALHIGHRRSIDFDLFKSSAFNSKKIISKIAISKYPHTITRRVTEQMNLTIHDVKFTFFEFPFKIDAKCKFENVIKMPNLIDLAAMKAYALGRRSKWKDYVDLYFILKDYYSINEIASKSDEIFGQMFSSKLFRAQLSYFKDIDYSEPVEYIGPAIPEDEIKNFLIDKAIEFDF